ncbi:hypothetical protein [Algoriphagus vanfongensis]|uniref:hypothetical protein n=1 Tax=Algoriphagus vanfongensis TaxID=426371 RepID=UPI00047EF341|nr:hypothetical protein [Algoriphagus vanfongensis]
MGSVLDSIGTTPTATNISPLQGSHVDFIPSAFSVIFQSFNFPIHNLSTSNLATSNFQASRIQPPTSQPPASYIQLPSSVSGFLSSKPPTSNFLLPNILLPTSDNNSSF